MIVAHQTPLSMGVSREEYWSELPLPSPGDLPNTGIESRSPTLQVDSLPAELPGNPKNTGVASLSLFQQIFLTQESAALQVDSSPAELPGKHMPWVQNNGNTLQYSCLGNPMDRGVWWATIIYGVTKGPDTT